MRELLYIWLVLANPDGGVSVRRLDQPYESEHQCTEAAIAYHKEYRHKLPQLRGALCYTPSEFDGVKK